MIRLHCRLDFCLSENLSIGNNDALLARVIRNSGANLRAHPDVIPAAIESTHGDIVGVGDFGKARAVAVGSRGPGPGAVLAAAGVFANEAGEESGRNGLEGGNGGGENPNVGLDDGPVHGSTDCVSRII